MVLTRTRSSSKSDDNALSSGVETIETSTLSSVVPLSVPIDSTSEDLVAPPCNVDIEGGKTRQSSEKPRNDDSLPKTPRRRTIAKRSSMARKSVRNEDCDMPLSTDESQSTASVEETEVSSQEGPIMGKSKSCLAKTPTRSRKRQRSTSNQSSPARITRSMRKSWLRQSQRRSKTRYNTRMFS
ncbi:hypothetical protein KIN20_017017 [Parelaphostrongylus tenuis]|uniref:Uncharacterized protein n=1 Tax=Parelaphostrongylus tenuis TaxID=148309 RepID=A0AAD5QR56_PARTN|nr:hypothetical protein KIN20_017017 [Parelaphostrongylus tenuis]